MEILGIEDIPGFRVAWYGFWTVLVVIVALVQLRRGVEFGWEWLRRWRKGEPMNDAANLQYKMAMRFHRAGEAAELEELKNSGHPIWTPSPFPGDQNKGEPPPPG